MSQSQAYMNQFNNLPPEIYVSIGFILSNTESNVFHQLIREFYDEDIVILSTGNIHVTLLSVGKIYTSTLDSLVTIMENIAERTQPMTCKNGRLIIVEPDTPERIWVRYDSSVWYENLVSAFEDACWKIGTWRFKRDRKGRKSSGKKIAQPHITIAKTREGVLFSSIVPPFELPSAFLSLRLDTLCIFRVEKDSSGNVIHTPLVRKVLEK